MKKILFTIAIVCGLGLGVQAQGVSPLQLSINYNIGIPLGDFSSQYVNLASFRGLNLELDYYFNDRNSLGLYVGWNGFYQKKNRQSYTLDRGALNGVRYNYLYQVPIYLKYQYVLKDDGRVNPYVAVGVGTHYIEQEVYIGYVGIAENTWNFGFAPELGTLVMMGQSGWSFKLAAIYHYTAYNRFQLNDIQNLGINLGFNYDF